MCMSVRREGRGELLSSGGNTKRSLPLNPPSLMMAEILSLARLLATSCERSKYKGQSSKVSNEFSRKPVVIRYFNISNFAAVEIGKKKEEEREEEDIKRRGGGYKEERRRI